MARLFPLTPLVIGIVATGLLVASVIGVKRQTAGLPTVEVRLFNVDHEDVEQLLVGCRVAGSVEYGQIKTFRLGRLDPSTVITVQVRNTQGAYSYGFELFRSGRLMLLDKDGEAGTIGARNDDFDHPHQLVYSRSFTPDGRRATPPSCVQPVP